MKMLDRLISDPGSSPGQAARPPELLATKVADARPEPAVRGERLLGLLERFFIGLNRLVGRALPHSLNPLAQIGAVANTTFAIALVTGILLLFWYSASVNSAYDSLEAMRQSPYLAELMRSLHRYSSDACMLFVVMHALQTLFARKVGNARWLAWVSGAVLVGLLWFDGWTGYWLVWDSRAQQIATGSANVLDVLPMFSDPISRSFLTDTTINSLLFFIVFFVHMLIPIAMGIFLWVHVMRLNKSKLFTNRPLSIAITVALVVVSLAVPATSAEPADMSVIPQEMTVDWYYLLPLFLTDRLTGGFIWLTVLFTTVVTFGLPWMLIRKHPVSSIVNEEACNGCTQCFIDCPFNAIDLIPRYDGKGENPVTARINSAKCVGCGICVGSCDSTAIDQARLPVLDARKWINANSRDTHVAFICAQSAGSQVRLNPDGSSPDLPGYRVLPVSCAGSVHMLTVERALRRGARGVLIAGCAADTACRYGADWTQERIDGERSPSLRTEHADRSKVRYVRLDRGDASVLAAEAEAFTKGEPAPVRKTGPLIRYGIVAAMLVVLAVLTVGLSDLTYRPPVVETSMLVVSFKHAGEMIEESADADDNEDLLPHMRGASSVSRYRVPVRLAVFVDGEPVLERSLEAGGVFNDGISVAVEEIAVEEGDHTVRILIGDTADETEWTYEGERSLDFKRAERRVVLFDRVGGFTWH